jgi:hypothetical protein
MQSASGEIIFLVFPTDEAHAAFITSVIEELGIGRDFGSVVVVPVAGGEASYRHLVSPCTHLIIYIYSILTTHVSFIQHVGACGCA